MNVVVCTVYWKTAVHGTHRHTRIHLVSIMSMPCKQAGKRANVAKDSEAHTQILYIQATIACL
jgi:hypothetical protein